MADLDTEQVWESKAFYKTAVSYWDRQDATVDGVLGGFGYVSAADIRDSRRVLQKVFATRLKEAAAGQRQLVALDCGSGVGRIAQDLLLQFCDEVDLVEPSAHLLNKAKQQLTCPGPKQFPANHRAVGFFQLGLQDFNPEPNRYDIFWVQWCLMYLTDSDVLAWLARCAATVQPGGIVVVKENLASGSQRATLDEEDASIARSDEYLRELFSKAKMRLLFSTYQKDFPPDLLKVKMYALRPQ